jgi:hypothetical protein
MIAEKQITDGSARVEYGSGEKPRYRALANAIDDTYNDLLRPLLVLRETVFTYLPLEEPQKAEEAPFRYLARHRRIIDEALSLFLSEMAGPDRSREGFVEGGMESDTPDGVLQQTAFSTMLVGAAHAADVVGLSPTIAVTRQSPAVKAMLDDAFTRLSESGKLRLENIRDDVHSILVSSTSAGLSPLETARLLGRQFDDYQGWQWQRLARTEAAFAAEAGSREQYRDLGVTLVTILTAGSPCPICQAWEGRTVPIEEVSSQPPFHPACLCTTVPAGVSVE